jgi:hypothetical protein
MPVDDIERQWVLQLANCMRGMPTPPLRFACQVMVCASTFRRRMLAA